MVNAVIRIIVVVALIHICSGLSTTKAGSTLTRFNQFISTLTTVLADGTTRAVHSSGGAAGGVVSEGQGYGVLIGGITAASLDTSHASFSDVATKTYQMFLGWKKMCKLSNAASSCQTGFYYCTDSSGSYPCLPHWKFDDAIVAAGGTGNAPDGDEDAILGMIALVMVTEPVKSKYTWWTEVAKWAYQSSKQFYESNTIVKTISGVTYPMLRLGACWGGWDCNNPSYHAPGAYRAFRNYIARYATTFGDTAATVTDYNTKYNNLIATSYAVILADQCDDSGLTTNWYVPSSANPASDGTTGCSGSGTAAAQYGSEAARGVWRVALDYLWYGNTANTANYLDPVIKNVAGVYSSGNFGALSSPSGCLVTSVFGDWTASSNAFISGPTFCALLKPLSTVKDQATILDAAGSLIAATTINAYYAGAWTAISTFTLNGDLERVGYIIRGGALPPPAPFPPPTPKPTPSPTPINPSSLTTYTCSYAYEDVYWIEFNLAAPTNNIVYAECSDGRQIKCVYNLNKWQCDPAGVQCLAKRNAIVKGPNPGCCSLGRGCNLAVYSEADEIATSDSVLNTGLIAGIVVASIVLVSLIVFIAYQIKMRYYPFTPMETY